MALRALSRSRNPEPLLRMLNRAQEFTASIDFTDLHRALVEVRVCHAFEADTSVRLRLPGEL